LKLSRKYNQLALKGYPIFHTFYWLILAGKCINIFSHLTPSKLYWLISDMVELMNTARDSGLATIELNVLLPVQPPIARRTCFDVDTVIKKMIMDKKTKFKVKFSYL